MSSRPITLELASGLLSETSLDQRAALVGVVEDLVSLLEAQFPSNAEFPADALRLRLQHSRDRLRGSALPEDLSIAGLRLVADASQAHARLSGYASAREAEFFGVIRLLRELVDGLRGDAIAFRHDLLRTSERVADLNRIEDIRTLRRALDREVDQLRQCVHDGERQESSRFAAVSGHLRKVDETMAAGADPDEHSTGLLGRASLLSALASSPPEPGTLVLCRIDEPDAIVDGHGPQVLERVIVALAQLLKGTFGDPTKVYRCGTQCVAMFLPRTTPRHLAPQVRKVQARVAPEYEYERQGVTRRVVFTFSSVLAARAGKTEGDGLEALARAEARAEVTGGLSQLHVESKGLARVMGWLTAEL